MELDKYKDWKEVISTEEFNSLINELIISQNKFSNSDLIELLNLLSEKYLLFYKTCELTMNQKIEINKILIKLTNFSNLIITEDLIGILFNFRLDAYFLFLREKCNTIKLDEVRNEVINSLSEYGDTPNWS